MPFRGRFQNRKLKARSDHAEYLLDPSVTSIRDLLLTLLLQDWERFFFIPGSGVHASSVLIMTCQRTGITHVVTFQATPYMVIFHKSCRLAIFLAICIVLN